MCTIVIKCEEENEKVWVATTAGFVDMTRKSLRTERNPLGPTTVCRSHRVSHRAGRGHLVSTFPSLRSAKQCV